MKSNRQTIRLKMHLFCAFFVFFCVFMSCEKEEEPKPIIVEKPGNQNKDETPELLSKWIYVGMEWDAEFIYDEANYLEFYSDSTYICNWFGEEQKGHFSIDSSVYIHDTFYYCTFSSFALWGNRSNLRWIYFTDHFNGAHFTFLPEKLQQMIEEMDIASHVLIFSPTFVDCFTGCREYFIAPRELETSGVKNKFQ